MFKEDITREINGVVQVEQNEEKIIQDELKEYVVTNELKKHFTKFFQNYDNSLEKQTNAIGVWVTGFFGSGKSHFLKMLSYILQNDVVDGKPTVEYFRDKFDDPATFMLIDKATSVPTETILFNIENKCGSVKNDRTIVRVFKRVFYEHCGYYGQDPKVAKLEKYLDSKGLLDKFKETFEEINSDPWEEARGSYAFYEDDVVEALVKVTSMSEDAARNWFNNEQEEDDSVDSLINEIKKYVDSKPKNFRLVFLADEVGQFVGSDTNLLLSLQTFVEGLGSGCRGQVWLVATGQEALTEMIKVRADEFSRIQARFNTQLTLTSSSVDEVIEKRLLSKNEQAVPTLKQVYNNNETVLKNLYAFTDGTTNDLRGYKNDDEYVKVYPFVPYQFIIVQNILAEIRKYGQVGSHQSSGERSMLSGFQESAKNIIDENELSIVPLYMFYDSIHSFLDVSVRRVIDRATNAANNSQGLTEFDVKVLKLLYLILYMDKDIKPTIDNITVLMIDKITVEKLTLKKQINESLERLLNQNYISRFNGEYKFLTDDEQDIQREINSTDVDTTEIVSKIGTLIFDDLYQSRRFSYKESVFDFDRYVDRQRVGNGTDGMRMTFITVAYGEPDDASMKLRLRTESRGTNSATCVLDNEYEYYENVQKALKIQTYIKHKNISTLPEQRRKIIQNQQQEATNYLNLAKEELTKAILHGEYYIFGEVCSVNGNDAKGKINSALEQLVGVVYNKLYMIDTTCDSIADLPKILKSEISHTVDCNSEALNEVDSYMQMMLDRNLTLSMNDIVRRYKAIPYGWRELDIQSVICTLIADQKLTVKHNGTILTKEDGRLITCLTKTNEMQNTIISKREAINENMIRDIQDILREYFDILDIPSDEDGLANIARTKFSEKKVLLTNLKEKCQSRKYPNDKFVYEGLNLLEDIVTRSDDVKSFFQAIINKKNELLDSKEDLEPVEAFFTNQVALFDNAVDTVKNLKNEEDYFKDNQVIKEAIDKIKDITNVDGHYNYSRIPELNVCISDINTEHVKLLEESRKKKFELIEQCQNEVFEKANNNSACLQQVNQANKDFASLKETINRLNNLALIDAKTNQIISCKDNAIRNIENALSPKPIPQPKTPSKRKKKYSINRNVVFEQKTVSTEEELDAYLAKMKQKIMNYLKDNDEVEID